jgi:hypothetical protein
MMLGARRARRRSEASYALSAWSLAGRLRGRPGFPRGPDDGRDSVDQRQQLGRVVGVGSREADHQRDAVAIHYQVILGAGFAPVDRFRPHVPAPLFAQTLRESTLARDQSTAASAEPVEQSLVEPLPNTRLLPVAQSSPAGRAAAAAEC